MKRKIPLLAGVALVSVAGLSLATAVADPVPSPANIMEPANVMKLNALQLAHARGHGWRGRHHGRFGCGSRGGRLERMTGIVEGLMEFTPEQQSAWGDLKTALNRGKTAMEEACKTMAEEDRPKSAPERLSRFERMMSTRLATLQSVRPAFEKFYGTLSEKQQAAIDNLFRHGRHGRKGSNGRNGGQAPGDTR